jgi:predicted transposase/invertase (TIGR01784 family)
VFVGQLDEGALLGLKRNPVALATLCAKRMFEARKNENKRYKYVKELLRITRAEEYTGDTRIRLVQFIDGMSRISTIKWLKELEDEIDNMLMEVKSMEVMTPVLGKVLRKRAKEWFRAEGKAEGIAEERTEMARRMFACGMELDVIAKVTGYTIEELTAIVN